MCIDFLLLAIFMVTSSYATYQEVEIATENFNNESIIFKVLERNLQYEKWCLFKWIKK